MRPSTVILAPALLLAIHLAPSAVEAQWPARPELTGVVVSDIGTGEYARGVVTDGRGGAIVLIESNRSGASGYHAQRIRSDGTRAWGANGVRLATIGQAPVVAADGVGGMVMAWWDERNGINFTDVTAQRVDSSGTVLWGTEGVSVCDSPSDVDSAPLIIADGGGGAVIAWSDARNSATTGLDAFAQRISAAGSPMWTEDGTSIIGTTGSQSPTSILRDAAGAFVFAIEDARDNATNSLDVYAQKLNASTGSRIWGTLGKVVYAGTAIQDDARLAATPDGGVFVAWDDGTTGTNTVECNRLDSAGNRLWATAGVEVFDDASARTLEGVHASLDGWIVVTRDFRTSTGYDIYAQRMSPDGVPTWTPSGAAFLSSTEADYIVDSAPDGHGGVIMLGYSANDLNNRLLAQRLNIGGAREWLSSGLVAVTGAEYSSSYTHAAVTTEGALVIARSSMGNNSDAFAHRVDWRGQVGDPRPAITRVSDVLADQGGRVRVEWSASPHDTEPTRVIANYSVWRDVPAALVATRAARASRPLRVEGVGLTATFWEFVASAPARARPGYAMVVETTTDSMPGSNPMTAFMVSAETSSGADYWDSAPVSGYSVDNLAPAAPAPLTGFFTSGATRLAWNPNTESDLAGYRLYRGTSAGFATGPATLVAMLPDTGYIDPAGAPYFYKLTAVDIHGNESPVAFLQPQGVLATDGPVLATRAHFAPPAPNPARPGQSLTLRFALAESGAVRLALHDAQGRVVRVLVEGARAAGVHAEPFDGRDAAGRPLAPGLYLARLDAPGLAATQRLVVIE